MAEDIANGRIGTGKVRMPLEEGRAASVRAILTAAPQNPWDLGTAVDVRVEMIEGWSEELMCYWYTETTREKCMKCADFWVKPFARKSHALAVCQFHIGYALEVSVRTQRELVADS